MVGASGVKAAAAVCDIYRPRLGVVGLTARSMWREIGGCEACLSLTTELDGRGPGRYKARALRSKVTEARKWPCGWTFAFLKTADKKCSRSRGGGALSNPGASGHGGFINAARREQAGRYKNAAVGKCRQEFLGVTVAEAGDDGGTPEQTAHARTQLLSVRRTEAQSHMTRTWTLSVFVCTPARSPAKHRHAIYADATYTSPSRGVDPPPHRHIMMPQTPRHPRATLVRTAHDAILVSIPPSAPQLGQRRRRTRRHDPDIVLVPPYTPYPASSSTAPAHETTWLLVLPAPLPTKEECRREDPNVREHEKMEDGEA
ncbi:hypothetical protein B0H16DRAFT_1465741 [Mycena metata]|uniref:Uncharacterized protein n=1 Tax=Mycena metata TaxID=1033252 RepID=A0AAD7IC22_9AGAR|nr:hypothetical protein B0H16DRAFT_1465741 [Mycena metata]